MLFSHFFVILVVSVVKWTTHHEGTKNTKNFSCESLGYTIKSLFIAKIFHTTVNNMWYAVSYFLKGTLKQDPNYESWEECIILVDSWCEDGAIDEAMKFIEKSNSYINMEGDEITWTFDSIESVSSILDEEIKHGVEIFSRPLKSSTVIALKTNQVE